MVNRSELFARPEVKKAITEMRGALREALPEASFGEREAQAHAISDEALREVLREDLQRSATAWATRCWSTASSTSATSLGPTPITRCAGPWMSAVRATE